MFHILILIIAISAFLGAMSSSLLFIAYSKEKSPIARYFLIIIFIMTVLVILMHFDYYFYSLKMFIQVTRYLNLVIHIVFYILMSQWIMTAYPSKVTTGIRIADWINKAVSFVLIPLVIVIFFSFERFFDYMRIINFFFGIISLLINLYIVFSEKNNIINKDGVDWKLYTRIYLLVQVFLYLFYTSSFLIIKKGFDLYLYLNNSYFITEFCYLFISIFSIIYLFPAILKPHYNIRQASVTQSFASSFDLTEREIEIASSLIEGMSYKNIGMILFISEDTVKSHVKNLYRKTGVNRRQDLIKVFMDNSENAKQESNVKDKPIEVKQLIKSLFQINKD